MTLKASIHAGSRGFSGATRYVTLRQCLKALRKGANLSQIELAARLGEDQSYVSKIERGDRYVDVLFFVDWCNACGVKPEEGLKALLQKC
jgi:transcriptional regulator with XRE-family HTH domain